MICWAVLCIVPQELPPVPSILISEHEIKTILNSTTECEPRVFMTKLQFYRYLAPNRQCEVFSVNVLVDELCIFDSK